jgi:nucleotide-binding universal stress UspA family protein
MEPKDEQTDNSIPVAADSEAPLRNTGEEPQVIVVAVDSSPASNRVISLAARLSRSLRGAAVHIVHVFKTSRMDRAPAGAPAGPNADAVAEAKEYLAFHVKTARSQCRNEVTGHFLVGDPTGEVLRSCKDLKADLLVIGTHDHSAFERLLLGSIAETLMRKATCSVLVVRPATSR